MRDYKNIVLWAVNCSGQSKNLVLYTMFCYEVNRQDGTDTITVKYFEKGYIFMLADSFHHQIEKGLKQIKKCETCDVWKRKSENVLDD